MRPRTHSSRFSLTLASLAVAAATVATGCNNSEEKLDPNDIAIQYAPAEMARTICTRAYDCCTAEQLMPNDAAGTSEATCEELSTTSFRNTMNAVERAQKRGRIVYHGDRLATCLANIRNATCDELNRTNHLSGVDCGATYLEPKVSPGGACDMDSECIDGTCAVPEGASEGICIARGQDGAFCGEEVRCTSGFACDEANHVCRAIHPDGATCTTAADCESGSCNAGPEGGPSTCGPAPTKMCFYASGCAAAGAMTASPWTAVATALGLALALLSRRRRRPYYGVARACAEPRSARSS